MLYALCGLPFAGKTTLATVLARSRGATVVRLDAINDDFGVGLHGTSISPAQWDRTYAEAYRRISDHLARGESVIFDHGNFNRAERDRLRTIALQHGAAVQFVYVPITPEESRDRRQRNRRSGERRDIRDGDFETALRMFEDPSGESDVTTVQDLGLPGLDRSTHHE